MVMEIYGLYCASEFMNEIFHYLSIKDYLALDATLATLSKIFVISPRSNVLSGLKKFLDEVC